ncbi:MAG TPA: Imm21 family immunity protein [Actinoplanes sp.]|nr:Imm21 family immunity protein [Actinoplanes sp.]
MVGNSWVSSLGGPLIVVPQSALPWWTGGDSAHGSAEDRDDYGRACAVDGFIGLIPVGEQHALVLGDDPADTMYLPQERSFLRWLAADREEDLVGTARRALRGGVRWDADEDVTWVVDGPVVLFDAAWSGSDLELEVAGHRVIDLEPGTYRVRAAQHTDDRNMMILVSLLRA